MTSNLSPFSKKILGKVGTKYVERYLDEGDILHISKSKEGILWNFNSNLIVITSKTELKFSAGDIALNLNGVPILPIDDGMFKTHKNRRAKVLFVIQERIRSYFDYVKTVNVIGVE